MIKKIPFSKIINIESVIALFVMISVFLFGHAFNHGDSTLVTPMIRNFLKYFILVDIAIVYALCLLFRKIELAGILIIPLIWLCVMLIDVYSDTVFDIFLFLRTLIIFFIPKSVRKKVFKLYYFVLVAMGIFSFVALISYYVGFSLLYRTVPYYEGSGEYLDFGFSFIHKDGNLIRLCGLFNEPGYYGTICALVLCARKINLKSIGNIVLLIAGVLTISLAFFLIIFIYLVVICFKKPSSFVLMIAFIFIWFFVISNIDFGNSLFSIIIKRLSFSNGSLVGDNRSNLSVDNTVEFIFSNGISWGYGSGYSSQTFYNVSTYKTYLVDYGFLGFALLFGSFLFVSLFRYKNNIYSLAFLACFFASIYQRPGIFNPLLCLILFGGLEELAATRRPTISLMREEREIYAI